MRPLQPEPSDDQPEIPGGQQEHDTDESDPSQKTYTNKFAIAALVCGVIAAPLAVVFAVVALRHKKGPNRAGRRMAIAGLVLAGLWAVIIAIAVLIHFGTDVTTVSTTKMAVGDCIETSPADTEHVSSLPTVACEQPHEGEVYTIVRVDSPDLPEMTVLKREYGDQCLPTLASYSPRAATDPGIQIVVLYPTQETWDEGDRDVVCIAVSDSKRSGSIK